MIKITQNGESVKTENIILSDNLLKIIAEIIDNK